MATILVVDDEQSIRTFLRSLLAPQITQVAGVGYVQAGPEGRAGRAGAGSCPLSLSTAGRRRK